MTSTERGDDTPRDLRQDDDESPDASALPDLTPDPPAAPDPERLSYADMLEQLEAMARQVANDAPPALRDMSAVAAIFGATTARNAGPIAHTLADATDVYGNRLADRLEAYAERVRAEMEQAPEDDEVRPEPDSAPSGADEEPEAP